jgi:mono/diheme cytochrome c family protein
MIVGASSCVGTPPDGSRVDNPYRGVMQDRSASSPGEALFVEKCGMCHRQMGMGTVILARRMEATRAPLEARTDLTPELIEVAVRQGIANMPRIGRGELSDAQLVTVTTYLTQPPTAQ